MNSQSNSTREEASMARRRNSCPSCGAQRTLNAGVEVLVEGLVAMLRSGRLKLVEPCMECVEKHVGQAMSNLETAAGQAMVKAGELLSGYPDRYFLLIGHLADAADEADAWPELKQMLLAARRDFQREGKFPDFKAIAAEIQRIKAQN